VSNMSVKKDGST